MDRTTVLDLRSLGESGRCSRRRRKIAGSKGPLIWRNKLVIGWVVRGLDGSVQEFFVEQTAWYELIATKLTNLIRVPALPGLQTNDPRQFPLAVFYQP